MMLNRGVGQLIMSGALICASASCVAKDLTDSGWFVGGQLSSVSAKFENDYSAFNLDSEMLEAKAGYKFTPNFALESNLGMVFDGSPDAEYMDDAALLKFSTAAKAIIPVSDVFQLYAKAGLSLVSFAYTYSYSYYDDEESFAGNNFFYGFGAEFQIANGVILGITYDAIDGSLEYGDDGYYDRDDLDLDYSQFGIGIHYQF